MTREEFINSQILPLRRNVVKLLEMEKELGNIILEKQKYIEIVFTKIASLETQKKVKESEIQSLDVQIETKKLELDKLSDSHRIEHQSHTEKMTTVRDSLVQHKKSIDNKKKENRDLELRKGDLLAEVSVLLSRKKELVEEVNEVFQEKLQIYLKSNKMISDIKSNKKILDKLILDIKRLSERKEVLVEDVLTEKNKKIYDRHQIQISKSQALDEQIRIKRQEVKKI